MKINIAYLCVDWSAFKCNCNDDDLHTCRTFNDGWPLFSASLEVVGDE